MRTRLILLVAILLCGAALVACEAQPAVPAETAAPAGETVSDAQAAAPAEAGPASGSDTPADSRELTAAERTLPASGSDTSSAAPVIPAEEPQQEAEPILFISADGSFCVQLPASWADKYYVAEEAGEAAFIESANARADFGGVLFYVSLLLADDDRSAMPGYAVIAERDGQKLVAYYPATEQYDASDAVLTQAYASLAADVADILASGISLCEG